MLIIKSDLIFPPDEKCDQLDQDFIIALPFLRTVTLLISYKNVNVKSFQNNIVWYEKWKSKLKKIVFAGWTTTHILWQWWDLYKDNCIRNLDWKVQKVCFGKSSLTHRWVGAQGEKQRPAFQVTWLKREFSIWFLTVRCKSPDLNPSPPFTSH